MNKQPLIKQLLKCQAPFMGYLVAILRDPAAAEEVFQETAVVLMEKEKKERFQPDNFQAWAKEVVRRQALKYINKHKRDSERLTSVEPRLIDEISRVFTEDKTTVSKHEQEMHALRKCLDKVPGRSRKLLALKYEKNTSLNKISEIMNSTAAAVQKMISRVRHSLKECIERKVKSAVKEKV
ncbi:sigma-70 family RNA polymerase sigma factor [Planctomycetota bacterium]